MQCYGAVYTLDLSHGRNIQMYIRSTMPPQTHITQVSASTIQHFLRVLLKLLHRGLLTFPAPPQILYTRQLTLVSLAIKVNTAIQLFP